MGLSSLVQFDPQNWMQTMQIVYSQEATDLFMDEVESNKVYCVPN